MSNAHSNASNPAPNQPAPPPAVSNHLVQATNNNAPKLGNFEHVPTEILEQIAGEVKYVEDLFAFTNSCREFKKHFGKSNPIFWYKVGKSRSAVSNQYQNFDAMFNYFLDIRKRAGIRKNLIKYCNICLKAASNNVAVFGVTCCRDCARENLMPIHEVRRIRGLDTHELKFMRIGSRQFAQLAGVPQTDANGFLVVYVWKPSVERKLATLFPGKDLSFILAATQNARTIYDANCDVFFQQIEAAAIRKVQNVFDILAEPLLNSFSKAKTATLFGTGQPAVQPDELKPILKATIERLIKEKFKWHVNNIRQFGSQLDDLTADDADLYGNQIVHELFFTGHYL